VYRVYIIDPIKNVLDMCVCVCENIWHQKVFQILFPHFVWEENYEKSSHSWWKKNVLLNAVFLKTYCISSNSVFWMWYFIPHYISSLYLLVEDLRYSQWRGFILQCGLGQGIVWFLDMVMNILDEYCESVFTGSRKMQKACFTKTWVASSQITRSHNSEDHNFQS
jgi:hypothetical protein